MRVCDVFNVYLHTNTTRLSQRSIYIRVGSILVYIRNTKNHVPHTFRTHSRLEIVWDQTYMRLWWLGIKHIHVHCFLSPDTYVFVWFFVILHPNTYAFVTKPYISPRKVQNQPGNPWDAYCSQKSAYCSLCPFTGMPEATSYQTSTRSSIFLIWRSVDRSVSHCVCRKKYGKRCHLVKNGPFYDLESKMPAKASKS